MKFPKYVIIPLCALALSSCVGGGSGNKGGGGGGGGSKTSSVSPTTSGPERYPVVEIKKEDFGGYYDTDKYTLNGTYGPSLQVQLHALMLDTHTKHVLYSQFKNYITPNTDLPYSVDQVSSSVKKNEYFYTGAEHNFSDGAGAREHVWPCAKSGGMWVHNTNFGPEHYVDNPSYYGGGSDLYHVRCCNSPVNSQRSDSKFCEFSEEDKNSGRLYEAKENGGKYILLTDSKQADYAEPADEFKGDIARICVYVWTHYGIIGTYNNSLCGALNLKEVFAGDDDFAIYDMICRWNEIDPPSETEKLRNETVFAIQGNRNPYVDYPHLMREVLNV